MKKLWGDFRAFAFSGNLIDLALGFIIGAAFASVVESLAKNVIGDIIAAIIGKPDYSGVVIKLGKHGQIHIGSFLTDLLSFVILAAVLFGLVQMMKKAKLGNFRAQGQRECPACKESIAVDASRCKFCTTESAPGVLTD